jgi:uncharacterized protein involved in exopolysaccharide biosynthesis
MNLMPVIPKMRKRRTRPTNILIWLIAGTILGIFAGLVAIVIWRTAFLP